MPLQATSGAASYDGFGGGVPYIPQYIEDMFSTYLYTGTGSGTSQTITNQINLSTYGGLVWVKCRGAAFNHALVDTVRGANQTLFSNTDVLNQNYSASGTVNTFSTTGFTVGTDNLTNANAASGGTFASWTFRKQPKFFDVVTYTGTGANRTVSHNLGSVPGCIIVKRTDTNSYWQVYHRSLANTQYLVLNDTAAVATGATRWNSTTPTSSVFSVGTDTTVNASGGTYVAYLFAHNDGGFGLTGLDNVISCGSFTTDGNGESTINLGWEPQWLLMKRANGTGTYLDDWYMADIMRKWLAVANGDEARFFANTSDAEVVSGQYTRLQNTGFFARALAPNTAHIYIAIRRGPMKVPTSGTSVFSPITANAAAGTAQTTNFVIDSQWKAKRGSVDTLNTSVDDRLRVVGTTTTESGSNRYLITSSANAEDNVQATTRAFNNTGFRISTYYASSNTIFYNFARAPGFFDVVCFTQTVPGNPFQCQSFTHNLGVVPELVIAKCRSSGFSNWVTSGYTVLGSNQYLNLNSTQQKNTSSTSGGIPVPTSTTAGVPCEGSAGDTYVVYLFATCPGVSKVGSYSGTGATQTINCGFTGGARFVLIKRTDTTGGWYVWDTARGMVAGTDPLLLLNTTDAELNTNSVYTTGVGFQIVSNGAGINASGGTYIFLAIA
jgi:hypothetical protein